MRDDHRLLRDAVAAAVGGVALFVAGAPWSLAGHTIRLTVPLALAVIVVMLAAAKQGGLRAWAEREVHLPPRAIAAGAVCVALFLLRIAAAQYQSLQVNAWDFSIYFDRPLERTTHGQLLWSPELGSATLAAHADWVVLLFVPLYALHPSPWWLVAAHALVLAGGCVAGFHALRRICGDDPAALALTGGFLFSRYTAKAAQYVFHHEIFYPLALFLVVYAALARRRWLLLVACLLVLAIKQDAFIPLAGVALALLVMRRAGAAVAVLALAVGGFAFDYFWAMPHFATTSQPWYAWYWSDFGPTPLRAGAGIATHPLLAAFKLAISGVPRLLATLLLLPLAGPEWLLAATPGLVIYGVAALPQLRDFDLYYSLPLLPLLYCAAASGAARLAAVAARRWAVSERAALRTLAMAAFLASTFTGAGYVIPASRVEAGRVAPLLGKLPAGTVVRVQSSLYPHAGYGLNRRPLDQERVSAGEGCLLLADAPAYPLSPSRLALLRSRLMADGRPVIRDGRLELFLPSASR
ncbi:MAG: putative rane protein [Acidobacteria bacterium]|nr:putative rane protein [Acidobacteriota bacterium]